MFEVRAPRKKPRKKVPKAKKETSPKPMTKEDDNLAEFARTRQAMEMMVNNCLSHTPIRNGYTHINQWYKEHRTVKFNGPRRSGKTTAAVGLARSMAFCPLFAVPTGLQKQSMEANFSLKDVCLFGTINREIQRRQPDWVVIDDPQGEFSEETMLQVYREGAPGLQLVILVN